MKFVEIVNASSYSKQKNRISEIDFNFPERAVYRMIQSNRIDGCVPKGEVVRLLVDRLKLPEQESEGQFSLGLGLC